ncbi:ABC transporter substrate-binding protein [Veillonella criceti]|uniref:Cyclodextrin-binding protein n=1 Tax=Veillonella criceti TaxID=103891 RepID=A0A380NMC1_9FIRM|nr:ABC transporter substrate-binding protein [Veillonella criceti]SUP43887.1 Cyclodextrin-binding protein precursor [Veillonella criceti]
MKCKALLAGLLCMTSALIFAGCGNSTSNTTPANDKVVEIEYWHVASDSFGGQTVRELVADFNKTHPNIKVTEKFNPDMYKGLTQNLQAALASGQTPDVVQMGWNFLNYAHENFENDDINTVFAKAGDPDFIKNTFEPNIARLAQTADGNQVGVPYSLSVPVLYYNPDIFKAAGLDPNTPPKTWAEVQQYAKQIKENTGSPAFFMQEYADTWTNQALVESNGGTMLIQKNGQWQSGFDTPEAAQGYQVIADMIKAGTGLHATNEEGFQSFTSGKLAMVATTIGKRANFEKSSQFKVMTTTFPAFDNKPVKVPAGGNFLMILSKDEAKQKAAVEFIKYLESAENLTKWDTGTGYLPPRKNMDTEGPYKKLIDENDNIKKAMAMLPNVTPWVSFPGQNGLQAEQVLIDARDVILNGSQTATEALHQAALKINELIK